MATPNLSLPYIDQNQSQKHVTHNEALSALDAVVQLSNRVVTPITGAASYSCGTSGSPTWFGSSLGVGAGATNRGLIGPNPFYSDTPVLYTAAGGVFSGGQVRMTIHYLMPTWANA